MRIIVLDLSGLEMLDAGGLGMFVFLHCWTRDNGIQLKLVTPSSFA
jgi:anti-anti-sigma regulatory factor